MAPGAKTDPTPGTQPRQGDASRVSRAQALAERLTEEIQARGLAPGSRLGTKEELRKRFGVAVATVNEAVRLLETSGFAEAKPGPGGGVFVAAPSSRLRLSNLVLEFTADNKTMADCLVIRNGLESLICLDAAANNTEADLAELDRILDEMETDDPEAFLRANWAFHRKIASIGANETLGSIYVTLLDFVEDELHVVEPTEQFHASRNVAVHRALAEAIRAGDEAQVRAGVTRHAPIVEKRAKALYAARSSDGSRGRLGR